MWLNGNTLAFSSFRKSFNSFVAKFQAVFLLLFFFGGGGLWFFLGFFCFFFFFLFFFFVCFFFVCLTIAWKEVYMLS